MHRVLHIRADNQSIPTYNKPSRSQDSPKIVNIHPGEQEKSDRLLAKALASIDSENMYKKHRENHTEEQRLGQSLLLTHKPLMIRLNKYLLVIKTMMTLCLVITNIRSVIRIRIVVMTMMMMMMMMLNTTGLDAKT